MASKSVSVLQMKLQNCSDFVFQTFRYLAILNTHSTSSIYLYQLLEIRNEDSTNYFNVVITGNNNTRGYESRKKFGWKMRRDISLGIARGFAFLHEEINPHIVHRDIKPANILLDKNFLPKIADFGLSKLFTNNTSHVSTRVAGTL